MKKPLMVCLAIIVSLMLTTSSPAQIYKYTDENGQKRWTDDLSQVPIEQRESAEHFEDMGNESQEPTTTATQEQDNPAVAPAADQPEADSEPDRQSLMKEKVDLEDQYRLLAQERKALEQMKLEQNDASNRTELNQRISAFNAKTKQYETQLNAYKKKVETYKKKIMPSDEPPTQ